MGTMFVALITLAAIANGTLLTYAVSVSLPLCLRLCAGSVIGMAALAWLSFLLSLALGLNTATIILTALIFALALIALLRLVTVARVRADLASIGLSRNGLIYYAAWTLFLAWLFARVAMNYPEGMHTAPANNYGDLPFHLSVVTSFAYGDNFPPRNPIFAGMNFTYPFLIDFLTAFFIRCGADWRTAFFLENFLLALALVGLIELMTRQLTGNNLAARLAPAIFLFNGGLGFINFFRDLGKFWNDPNQLKYGLVFFLEHLPKTYTMNAELNEIPLRWGNVLTTMIIPQRSMLFGLPIVAMIITLWWIAIGESGGAGEREKASYSPAPPLSRSPALLLSSGILAGILPMLHTHGFLAVMMASVVAVLLFPSRRWIAFYLPAAVLAAPQVWWLKSTPVKESLFKFEFWREAGDANLLLFWSVNAGIFILLLLAALLSRSVEPRLKRFYLPFILWFLVPNLVTLAPWSWDNIKVLIYWSLASGPLVAVGLADLFRKRLTGLLAAVILGALTLSGVLDVMRGLSAAENLMLFGKEEIEVAAILREKTPPHSLILDAPIHNSVAALSGRQAVMGYPGHLWTHGIDYRQREREVAAIFGGQAGAAELISRLEIDYVIIGPAGRSPIPANEAFFASRYPLLFAHGNYRVYRVR